MDKQEIDGGIIYLAPADYHLMIAYEGAFDPVTEERIEKEARTRADELIADARRQIAEEMVKAKAELKAQVVDLAIDAAGRLVKANLDERAQRALVEEYIAQLPANRAA